MLKGKRVELTHKWSCPSTDSYGRNSMGYGSETIRGIVVEEDHWGYIIDKTHFLGEKSIQTKKWEKGMVMKDCHKWIPHWFKFKPRPKTGEIEKGEMYRDNVHLERANVVEMRIIEQSSKSVKS